MIDLYKKYDALRDRFEILALHNSDVDTLAEMDRRTAKIQERYWGENPLPFPVLLDDESLTASEYTSSQFPTYMLVDPKGKVVERGGPELLEKELARIAKEADGAE